MTIKENIADTAGEVENLKVRAEFDARYSR